MDAVVLRSPWTDALPKQLRVDHTVTMRADVVAIELDKVIVGASVIGLNIEGIDIHAVLGLDVIIFRRAG